MSNGKPATYLSSAKWNTRHERYQAHTTQADVLAKAKTSYTLTIVFTKGYKAQGAQHD